MIPLLRDGRAVALLLAATLTILSNTLISPALPGIQAAFGDQPNVELLVPLLVTAPSLMVAIVAPFAGALADRFGRRRQLLVGVLLFALAGTAGLWLTSLTSILVSRLLLGVAVALVMTAQTALIGDYFAGPLRARFMGLQIASTNLAGFVLVLVAGGLAGQSPFLPFALYFIGLLYLPLMWLTVKEPDGQHQQQTGGNANTGEKGWPITLGFAFALAALSLIGFYLVPTQAPFYLTSIGYPEPAAAAMMLATVTLAGGVVSLTYGRVRARFGRAITPAIGLVLFACGFGLLSVTNGFWSVLVSAALLGAATGLLFPIFLSIAIDIAPAARRGLAAGAVTMAIFLGQFLSPVVARPLIEMAGYSGTFALFSGLFVLLAILAFYVFRERPQAVCGGAQTSGALLPFGALQPPRGTIRL